MAILTRTASLLAALTIFHLTSGAEDREALAPFLGIRYKLKSCDLDRAKMMSHGWYTTAKTLTENDGKYTLTKEIYHPQTGESEVIPFKFEISQNSRDDIDGRIGYSVVFQNGTTLTQLRFLGRGLPEKAEMSFTPSELKCVNRFRQETITCEYKPEEKGENDK